MACANNDGVIFFHSIVSLNGCWRWSPIVFTGILFSRSHYMTAF
jgi:hypothetical protein